MWSRDITTRSQTPGTLEADPSAIGWAKRELGFRSFVSWSGRAIGRDRGSPVADYAVPFAFTGVLKKVTVTMDADKALEGEAIGEAETARQ